MRLLGIISLLVLMATALPAAIVYSQAPEGTGTVIKSAWYPPDGLDGDIYAFDDFVLNTTQNITEIRWRGGYTNYLSGAGKSPVFNFIIRFYANINTANEPDVTSKGLVKYSVGGNAGETLAGTFGGVEMYDYHYVLPKPFIATAGVKYWLQIEAEQGVTPFYYWPPDWGFSRGTGGTGGYFRAITGGTNGGGTLFQRMSGDLAFTLVNNSATQPDLWVRRSVDAGYLGDNLYTESGAGQTISQAIDAGTTAAYYCKVQNDGLATDTLTVTAPAASAGWGVKYQTMGATPVDITAQITGAGWSTGALLPNGVVGIVALVNPASGLAAGLAKTLTITAASGANPAQTDVAVLTTAVKLKAQPDLWLRTPAEVTYIGDAIYTIDGTSQTRQQTVATGAMASYLIKVQNDGNTADVFTLKGAAGGSGWVVKYLTSTAGVTSDITTQVTGAGWSPAALPRGGTVALWVSVNPSPAASSSQSNVILLTATSQADGKKKDAVKLITSVVARYQPDLLIRNSTDAGYSGDNVYTADGTGESKGQSVAAGAIATYLCKVQNDGNSADAFTLTGPAGGAGWTVKFFAAGVGEITTQVTGAGWTTPLLVQAGSAGMWFTVSPDSGVAAGTVHEIRLTAVSTQNPAKVDAVNGSTTRP